MRAGGRPPTPRVLAIKQKLYRTAKDSPIVSALLKACEKGEEVQRRRRESRERFDEANNIEWVRVLEGAGAPRFVWLRRLKTHCKRWLIVARTRRQSAVTCTGTGNYHTGTARSIPIWAVHLHPALPGRGRSL